MLSNNLGIVTGIFIGILVAFKVNFLTWPIILLLSGHYRVAIVSMITFLILSAFPLMEYGADIYLQWLNIISQDAERIKFPTNISIAGGFALFSTTENLKYIGIVALVPAAIYAYLMRPPIKQSTIIGLALGVFASPIAWIHYMLFLLPWLMERRWNLLVTTGSIFLITPVVLPLLLTSSDQNLYIILGGMIYKVGFCLMVFGLLYSPDNKNNGVFRWMRWRGNRPKTESGPL
jgi:hypothetical protein